MKTPARQSGFAIIAAIFLLVVLAAMVAYMMALAAAQRQTANLALFSARTMEAARAGLEWGIYQKAGPPPGHLAAGSWSAGGCAGSFTVQGVAVTVACTEEPVEDGAVARQLVTITSTAESGDVGSPDYVRKVLRTTLVVP